MTSRLVHTVAELRAQIASLRADGARIALVPTMGALHAGHLELVRTARRVADRVVMSVFVNPRQFGPSEDFTTYPRSLAADREKFDAVGGDLVYAPEGSAMYPLGFATSVVTAGPATVGLEDRFRPDHFAGVTTVVAKLLLQTQPDVALFGEKDYQQLCVIRRMTLDLDLSLDIAGVPTVRDTDGLALSSRNVYLSEAERAVAPQFNATLRRCAATIRDGDGIVRRVAEAHDRLSAAGFTVDYVEARESTSLLPLSAGARGGRILAAVRLGRTRLIDNVALEEDL